MPEYHNDATLPVPTFPGSHLVLDDDYVFVSGLAASDIQGGETVLGDIVEETRWVMRRLEHMLASVDCDLTDVVRADIHLADLDDLKDMNAVYAEFFPAGHYPARTCTESPRLSGDSRVEITLMARRRCPPRRQTPGTDDQRQGESSESE